MDLLINGTSLLLVKGDITREKTDAIVNAANPQLAGGGGVDGAIHRAGGASIMAECRVIGACPTGEAVITSAGKLSVKKVVHTVGPIYRGGKDGEEEALRSAYRNSLRLAAGNGLHSISFPSISTGVYGYPVRDAARAALSEIVKFIKADDRIRMVRFVLFSEGDLTVYKEELKALKKDL